MPILFQEDTTQSCRYGYREQIYSRGNTTRLLYHTDLNDLRARVGCHAAGETFPELRRFREREEDAAAKEDEEKTREEEKGSMWNVRTDPE